MCRKLIILLAWISLKESCIANDCAEIQCASNQYKPNTCKADGIIQSLTVSEQISKSPCEADQTFYFVNNEIHVNDGCRANFTVCYRSHEDGSSSNHALYVSVPLVIIVVVVAGALALLFIRRRRQGAKREQDANTAVTNQAYTCSTLGGNPVSQYSDLNLNTCTSNDNEYNYIQCDTYDSCRTTSVGDDVIKIHNNNLNYNNLSSLQLPRSGNNYSNIVPIPSSFESPKITDNTYSQLRNNEKGSEKTDNVEEIDQTYNRLQSNKADTRAQRTLDHINTSDSSEYSRAVAGGPNKQTDSGDYSHLGQHAPVHQPIQVNEYEQPITGGTPHYLDFKSDYLNSLAYTPADHRNQTQGKHCVPERKASEEHDYFVLMKNNS